MNKVEIAIWSVLVCLMLFRVRRWSGPNSPNSARIPLLDWILAKLLPNPRESFVGFGPAKIAPRTTAIFQADPQVRFRGSRLIVPSALNPMGLEIEDIRVGRKSQRINASSVPAAAFSEAGIAFNLGLDVCRTGQIITLSVSNVTDQEKSFQAMMIGTTGWWS